MIARINSGYNVRGMVHYNYNKVAKNEAKLIYSNNIINTTQYGIQKIIESHNALGNSNEPNIHISLNFHKDDVLSEIDLVHISEDYMQKMGYENQPYAVFEHYDAGHKHVHIVSSRIDITGTKINDSFEFRKSVRITEEIEKDFNLVVAKDQSSNKKLNRVEEKVNIYINTGKGDVKNLIDEVLYNVLNDNPKDFNEFERSLNRYNITCVINENKGLTYFLYKETLVKENEFKRERVGKSINANQTTKKLLYKDWEALFARNSQQKTKLLKNIRGRIFGITNTFIDVKPILLSEFELKLKKKGIKLNVLRAKSGDKKGSIIGVSFTDFKSGFNYTGEEIKLKWSALKDHVIDDKTDKSLKDVSSNEILIEKIESNNFLSELEKILTFTEHTQNDYQEDLNIKKKRRKKRK